MDMAQAETAQAETAQARGWRDLFAARVPGMENDALATLLSLAGRGDVISFAGGLPDPATFLTERLAEAARRAIVDEPGIALQYGPTPGLPRTRDWFRAYLARQEGVAAPSHESVMVTSGGVEALDLLNKILVDPGDVVLMEAPSYLGAEMVTTSYQGRVVGVPIDEEGLDVAALEETLVSLARRGRRPKFLYTIPDHQNPSGITLTDARRAALVALAAERDLLIVEDIAYRRLGFDAASGLPPTLWSLNPAGVVLVDTFAKTLFPAARVACVAAPPEIVMAMTLAKQTTDQFASTLSQVILVTYDEQGALAEQVEGARLVYRRRRDAMLAALDDLLPADVRWTRPEGGFFTWLTLPEGLDSAALTTAAAARGIAYVPGQPFFAPGADGWRYLRLSYSYVRQGDIVEGVRRLATVIADGADGADGMDGASTATKQSGVLGSRDITRSIEG